MKIRVNGIPAPQGSKRHVGGGRMVEVSRAVGPWREAVRAETQRALAPHSLRAAPHTPGADIGICRACIEEGTLMVPSAPVRVQIDFTLPKPKSTPKKVTWPAKRPDLDKLVRAVLDGLVAGGAIHDDGQVVYLVATKMFPEHDDSPGCSIYVQEMEDR